MNYLPYVSWGVYGATSVAERALYYASWGLLKVEGGVGTVIIGSFKKAFTVISRKKDFTLKDR